MDESEENMSAEDIQGVDSAVPVKIKPKKRSLVERELETNLTARVTSPVTSEGTSTSRYGRARKLKTGLDVDLEKVMKPLKVDVKPQPQAYKMHASNSPIRKESPKRAVSVASSIEDQIENIYNENISLSRFGSEEKANSQSPVKKFSKVYIRKDMIQKPDTDTVVLIKNMFSPSKPSSHLNNILERSSEKYSLNGRGQAWNGFPDTSSVVKTLDFDSKKQTNSDDDGKMKKTLSKNELFELEASCEYQVGDLAWARVGTYPFWPCIVTREPYSDMFVKKKLFGRVERFVLHVTFFGDNGRRGWIVDNMLRKYHGRAEFEAAREKFTPEAKKKDPRLYAAHFVSEKKLPLWNVSVDEAETLMKEPKRLRIDILYDMLEKSRTSKTTPAKREKSGKVTRTDSDVSLSESLYDTLFSEDDGKTDDGSRSKRARNKSLDVSEVVTACLDNMAAKSGIIQIQRQSHMDRWLQKAKSKTPEKMQQKLQTKVNKEKRKEKVKKDSKKTRKLRKNESLSSDTNLLPYQNEHDYSSVNYENHNINDSSNTSNKNTDSASGHDSTLDNSGIEIVIKVECLSSSIDDCSQDDIITTVVNDDIVMTEPENISKDVDVHDETTNIDNANDRIENNNDLEVSKNNENGPVDVTLQIPLNKSNVNTALPRRSKRKRQTLEGLNNSTTENKAKEPKLDLAEEKTNDDTNLNSRLKDKITKENTSNENHTENTKTELDKEPSDSKIETSQRKFKSKECMAFNSNVKAVVVIEPLKLDHLATQTIIKIQNLDSVIQNYSTINDIGSPIIVSNEDQTGTGSKTESNTVNESQQDRAHDSVESEESKLNDVVKLLTPFTDVSTEHNHETVSKVDQQVAEGSLGSEEVNKSRGQLTPVIVDVDYKLIPQTIISTIDPNPPVVGSERVNKSKGQLTPVIVEKVDNNLIPRTTISTTDPELPVPIELEVKNKVVEVTLTSDQENKEILNEIIVPNVVIGEETYIFDRTLSQDYDEVDADRCDELNSVPTGRSTDLCNEEVVETRPQEDNVFGNEEISHEKTSYMQTTELIPGVKDEKTTEDAGESLITPNDGIFNDIDCSKVATSQRECNISDVGDSSNISNSDDVSKDDSKLDIHPECSKGNVWNDTKIEDNQISAVKSDVTSITNPEQIQEPQRETEEKNTQSIFLDRAVELANAQFNDKNRKPLRFSLKRNRYNSTNISKKSGDVQNSSIESLDNSLEKVNFDVKESDQESEVKNSDNKPKARSKDVIADEKMKDPDFVKYLEFRQDALIDEHPDLSQEEIVTYLYKNWLYEEGTKSDIKKTDDVEQYAVKGLDKKPVPQVKKIKLIRKKPKVEKQEPKKEDIRNMMQKRIPEVNPDEKKTKKESVESHLHITKNCVIKQDKIVSANIEKYTHKSYDDIPLEAVNKLENTDESKAPQITDTEESKNLPDDNITDNTKETLENSVIDTDLICEAPSKDLNTLCDVDAKASVSSTNETSDYKIQSDLCPDKDISDNLITLEELLETEELKKPNDVTDSTASEDLDTCACDLERYISKFVIETSDVKVPKESPHTKINGIIENKEIYSESKVNEEFDAETASIKSEDSEVSISKRKVRPKEKQDTKKGMDDPEFVKYLEARQDALIEELPDLTQEEIATYLYQTWFYEESFKSDIKKTDETEQSNLVKGLNQEPAPQPRKYKKKPKVEKDPDSKNVDIRVMMKKEKPKRKATQSTPYYNEDFSDLEEEDLETFKIFDGDEIDIGEEIDEVELYFEQLTKPKPNVFKGYVRERVCEICEKTGNLVKCKSCHGTFHVDCVKKEADVIEVAAPTRGRKKKRGRKPKGYDPLLDSGSQSDERSQDANNSEEMNVSVEDETESHLVVDADYFESQWELKMKELQTENQEEYVCNQKINWEVKPGHCEIVDVKQKEKPIDYSDYKCNTCLKHDTPLCFVCKSDKSPKTQTDVRQKCQVAHCHRYYHLDCLDNWPQTQFNSWEPMKNNKKEIEYIEALTCPRHVCHTCVSDDPRGCKTRFSGDKLARCVKCPATYHSFTKCLPAGTQILTGSQIICPRHYEHRPGKVPCHVNTGWCFICALGGTLICCEYCPTSFHAECLNIKPPEGSYMCEDCETGRLPLYGEMVWVKLGHYRWWPGVVLHPTEIPDNILAVKHSPGEFVVRFFGQYDHYWVNRGRVFPFQEGDSGKISSQKSKIDAAFTTAMEHAQRACEILKKMEPNEEEDMDIASSLLPPHYVKLKANKPVGGVGRRDVDANSLTQCDCDPTLPDPCGPYSHCLNRMLLTECGPLCRAGERCNNRAFEKRLYPRLAAYRTHMRGWGLRTLEDIKQGQFVIEYVGELIDMEEFRRRMCRKHEIRDENFYFLTLDKERMIDAGPKGNLARFMNHCCEPNCETQKWTVLGDVRVGLFALRDIPANSEVTFNYNLECAGIEKKRCLCGAKRCSGYIGAKPKQLQDDQPKKTKQPAKRTYRKRKHADDSPSTSKKVPKIKIKPLKPRELTEIEKDLLIIKNATNGMSSDSEGSRLSSADEKNPKALKRKRVSFSTEEVHGGKKVKLNEEERVLTELTEQ